MACPRRPPGRATSSDDEREAVNESEAVGGEDEDLRLADDRLAVRALLRWLAPRERRIVFLRYFEGLSQSDIAERVGVSQVHVSRLLRASLERLKRRAAGVALPDEVEQPAD